MYINERFSSIVFPYILYMYVLCTVPYLRDWFTDSNPLRTKKKNYLMLNKYFIPGFLII